MLYTNSKYTLVSVDIETLGTRPTSKVLSIGIQPGDTYTLRHDGLYSEDTCRDPFYEVCSLESQPNGTEDAKTLEWWQQQEANEVLSQARASKIHTTPGKMLSYLHGLPGSPIYLVNGLDFDLPILSNLISPLGCDLPGNYRHKIDLRTLRHAKLVEGVRYPGLRHHALLDAKAQLEAFYRCEYKAILKRIIKGY
jgi:hypothetical protein